MRRSCFWRRHVRLLPLRKYEVSSLPLQKPFLPYLRGEILPGTLHIHCLITEGGFSDDGFWRVVKHFNYTLLRKSFQTVLFNELEHHIVPSFKKTKALIYPKDKNGFYIYAKPNLCDTDTVVKYISRYLGRPVIALKRIDSYDGENVTFHYNRHEDNAFVQKTLSALDFIRLLIQHIPEKNFKMTRYYGLYARHRKKDKSLYRAVPRSKHQIMLSFTKWRNNILLSFGYAPLNCPQCNHKMELMEVLLRPPQSFSTRTLRKGNGKSQMPSFLIFLSACIILNS